MTKWVYSFGDGKAEGEAGMRNLLGGKGANLAEMSNLGLPVPPGFTVTTEVCTWFYDHGRAYPPELKGEVQEALAGASTPDLALASVDGDEAEALKSEAWELDALAERGYFNEKLDQLLVDVLLGVR